MKSDLTSIINLLVPIPFLKPKRHTTAYGELGIKERLPKIKRGGAKLALRYLISGLLGVFVIGSAVVIWVSRDLPDPNKLSDRQMAQSTKIYDRSGEHLLYEVYQDQKRTLVELNQMSPWLPKATIAIEDKHFYEHRGIRVISILRAAFNNLIGRRSGSGGASTLTQQLIKNTVVGNEHSVFRKIKEAILALQLEKKYSKDEILKMYLNEVPYGSTNLGVEAASQSYFHKKAADLNLAEAATLAALTKAPSRYLNNLDVLRGRRDYVLQLLQEQGQITEEQKNEAQNSALRLYRTANITTAPHFVLYVKQLLADQFGEALVDTGGLKVITTLDYDKQLEAEKIVKENGDKFAKEANANNAALVAIDPRTAQVLAMVGSRDFYDEKIDGQFNVAVLGKRQPGSSFKPFVYTAAFEKGYTPDTVLYDVLTNFDRRVGGKYTPQNYDHKEHGLVTMRGALQNSLNIPAVKTLYLVGTNETIEFAKRFGYTTFTGDPGLSLVLGGAEVNLLEHTNAYATLADNGVYHQPINILKVTNNRDEVLYEWVASEGQEAIKPELSALISSVLTDDEARAQVFGRNSTLVLPDRPAAAKTGTTNDYKDAWTMGYVPSLAVGVWVGNTKPAAMKGGGNKLAGVIWNQFMRAALKDVPAEQFPAPPANDAIKPVLRGSGDGIKLPINKITGKIASSSTPDTLVTIKTYLPPHDILHYVRRADPRGPAPENPADDPQYESWEAALQDWVKRLNDKGETLSLEEPPTEIDPPQSSELIPTISFVAPSDASTLFSRQLEIRVQASAPRGVARVTYKLDNLIIGSSYNYPFGLSYYAQKLSAGEHTLKAIAEDDLGNAAQAEIKFILDAGLEPPTISWADGEKVFVIAADFPRAMVLAQFRYEEMKDIKIYLDNDKLIYTFKPSEDALQPSGNLMFIWKTAPAAGEHTLRAVMTDKNGGLLEKILTVVMQ